MFRLSLLTIALTFVWASVVALVFRFPIPLGGYARGIEAAMLAPMAVAFYGILFAGFVVPVALAILVHAAIHTSPAYPRARMWIAANTGAVASVLALAVLDYIIGPW